MPNYFNPYQQFSAPLQNMQQPQPQIQNGGFVSVRNEEEARNYPVALGNSVTFKDETAPYIYTKTMGFSQLDVPRFDKYKLVKETPAEPPSKPAEPVVDLKPMSDAIDDLKGEIQAIWAEIEVVKNDHDKSSAPTRRNAKREKDGDD